jgi:hypothetical protein
MLEVYNLNIWLGMALVLLINGVHYWILTDTAILLLLLRMHVLVLLLVNV